MIFVKFQITIQNQQKSGKQSNSLQIKSKKNNETTKSSHEKAHMSADRSYLDKLNIIPTYIVNKFVAQNAQILADLCGILKAIRYLTIINLTYQKTTQITDDIIRLHDCILCNILVPWQRIYDSKVATSFNQRN